MLYDGGDKLLRSRRLEAGWAVIGLDHAMSVQELEAYLETVRIQDRLAIDREVPRTPDTMPRRCALLVNGEERVVLSIDPYDTLA
ncbi:hypothetical protein D3C86_2112330 [compost metagenome]